MHNLILPCEVGVKTVLPAIKAIMARSIVEKHDLNEKQTADLLGLSQSAVSRYIARERGNLLNIESTPEIPSPNRPNGKSHHKTTRQQNRIPQTLLPNLPNRKRKRPNVPQLPKRNATSMGRKMSILPRITEIEIFQVEV